MSTTNDVKRFSLPWALASKSKRTLRSQARAGKLELEASEADTAAEGLRRKKPLTKKAVQKAEKKEAKERELAEAKANAKTRWHHERQWAFASKLGFYDPAAPGIASSTRQMEFSHMAIASPPPTSHRGLVFGVDAGSGWMIVHDPFTAYGDTLESPPNVCYIGDLGQGGKSSAMKTWGGVLRQLILGRRVVVIDKKYQKDVGGGEYTRLRGSSALLRSGSASVVADPGSTFSIPVSLPV